MPATTEPRILMTLEGWRSLILETKRLGTQIVPTAIAGLEERPRGDSGDRAAAKLDRADCMRAQDLLAHLESVLKQGVRVKPGRDVPAVQEETLVTYKVLPTGHTVSRVLPREGVVFPAIYVGMLNPILPIAKKMLGREVGDVVEVNGQRERATQATKVEIIRIQTLKEIPK